MNTYLLLYIRTKVVSLVLTLGVERTILQYWNCRKRIIVGPVQVGSLSRVSNGTAGTGPAMSAVTATSRISKTSASWIDKAY